MSKILLIEDDQLLQEIYELVLKNSGHEVTVSSNGMDGLNALKKTDPDLILLDIFMPVMDGREFLRNFNKDTYPRAKVIVYSNLSDSKTRAEMMELGADDFILKSSFTPDDLLALISRTLAN